MGGVMRRVLRQECVRFNKLFGVLRASLTVLWHG